MVHFCQADPVSSMQAMDNDELAPIAIEIRSRLEKVMNSLS